MDLLIAANLAYGNLFLAKNRIEINIDAADLLIVDRSELRYLLKLQVRPFPNAASWEDLPEMDTVEEPIETIGGAIVAKGAFFQVDKILKSYVETSAPAFDSAQAPAKIFPVNNLVKPFRYVATVKNGSTVVSTVTSDIMYAIRSGINEKFVKEWGVNFFSKYIGAKKGFLTWNPTSTILPNQPVFLYFLNNLFPTPAALKLRVFRWYVDGSYDIAPETMAVQVTQGMTVYSISVGCEALGIDIVNPYNTAGVRKVAKYMVWLVNENEAVVSAMQTYTIDWGVYDDTRVIVFRNSLGGYDSLGCTGRIAETMNVVREATERIVPFDSNASFSEIEINNVTGERKLVVSTGWLDNKQRAWLEELALSEDIYLRTDREFIPLEMVDESYAASDSRELLIGRTFVFKYTNVESNFSDLPVIESEPERAKGWRAYAYGGCELDSFGKRTGKMFVTHIEHYYIDDNSKVKPIEVKLNVPGTEGFIEPQINAGCATSAFLNQVFTAEGTFKKQNCIGGLIGGPAIITIDAGRWGSEESLAKANEKAMLEWGALNTQAYANANGVCLEYVSGGLSVSYFSFNNNPTGIPSDGIFSNVPIKKIIIGPVLIDDSKLVLDGVPTDYVALRAVGFIKAPTSGTVTFYVKNDDGVRVWIGLERANVSRVLTKMKDNWYSHNVLESSFSTEMIADSFYCIQIDWFDWSGSAVLELAWSYTGQSKVLVPLSNLYHE